MSLKVFHVIFVLMALALCVVCALWSFQNQPTPLVGYGAILAGLGFLVYGVWFLRKARHIIT